MAYDRSMAALPSGTELLTLLGLALALGLLIGIERGWSERRAPEGGRIAGIRTHGLLGLLGGLSAVLGMSFGPLALGLAFVAVTGIIITAYIQTTREQDDYGITTEVAGLITFVLGAVAVGGEPTVASVGAVITTALLSLKPILHGWLRRLEQRDLYAGIKLLLISVVMLPLLPDHGFGPWETLNPREIWLMVVLIATLSFAGYLAIKVSGAQRGIMLTGLLGGLVSSTATTASLARLARDHDADNLSAAGILLASGMMLPRLLLVVGALAPALVPRLLVPAGAMALVLGIGAAWLLKGEKGGRVSELGLRNPVELRIALTFGGLLALVMMGATALYHWAGESGLYAAAALAGIADVDAISLSLARLSQSSEDTTPMHIGIVIATLSNTLLKGGLAASIGGRGLARLVVPTMCLSALAGGVSLLATF